MAAASTATQEEQAAQYGWSYAVLRSNPELSALFDRAVKSQFTGARFVAELRDTKWYKSHGESYRQAEVLKKADPAEWNRRREAMRSQISDVYYGLTGRRAGGTILWKFADQALMYGYGEGEIRDLAGRMVQGQNLMKHGGLGGQLGDAERQLRQAAEDYGLPFSDTAIARQVNAIAQQQQDLTSTIAYYRKAAASKYAGFANEIKAGMTVKDIAEPYKQLMAKTLEISDRGISVNDGLIQKALTHRQMVGKKLGPPAGMALHEFEKQLKNDPRWGKTNNARDSVMNVGLQVLRDFGFEGAA
jgi:hypothetical protein